ncbi:MAG: ribose 5-phosphate isomerase B [Omnitrophica WOR_2 bacterium]|jgi:ribose 5-phosphate isomerase B
MKIIIASDHAGFDYKTLLINYLQNKDIEVLDLGAYDTEPSDYPDHAEDVANAIINNEAEKAVIICGSGVGVCVAVNKFKGIRAGVCHDTYSAHQCVEHDNANVLCLGQRVIGIELAYEIVDAFINATFKQLERYERRLEKINAIENKNMKEDQK